MGIMKAAAILKTARWLPVALLAYLGIAMLWAWIVFDDALASAPLRAGAPLSAWQERVLLQVEDPTFYEHHGLSLADGQGVATITSAVTRDLFLVDAKLDGVQGALQALYRAVFACCKRVDFGRDVMSLVLDARMGKRAQLDRYVATIYMGMYEGWALRGLDAAARAYAGKPLVGTSEAEFIRLVAMLKAPDGYHPVRDPGALRVRSARIAALVAGHCRPSGWFDTTYPQCGP
jgi:membrane carboxypeptidase/penicillin-binding protein